MPKPTRDNITGVILAGGRARRMGGQDKGLIPFGGRPLVAWIIEALGPQVGRILINANRNTEAYAALGYPVVADCIAGFQGPLAGIATAMAVAETPWILTLPCDGPYPPPDLAQRLAAALTQADTEIAVARDAERLQPVHALLPVALALNLHRYLAAGERRIDTWYAQHRLALADFSDCPLGFANLNAPQDAQWLAAQPRP
ncbi:MAG: molybdenum cofactor guanylyltransferase [Chromatiaceae bacterium]|nr:molybdenum cofactor guanylyltransferase [Chromatiaceae bacterium]MBP8289784.1 molybdenum cofactor guanylyltransferase [Chromatiaceae bacterium]